MDDQERVLAVLAEAKKLAQEYRALTGKPLGITGEVAEYEAARLLGVELAVARQAGYDAIDRRDVQILRLQIKGRCLLDGSKPGQRLGSIRFDHAWDAVLMVLLDSNFDATSIWEASRERILNELTAPGSRARNDRGALAINQFRRIARRRWPPPV